MSEETFFRPDEFSREERTLPAALYNLARLLIGKSESGHVFIPIRSMQYLAVLDMEEFIFVNGAGNRTIAVAWRRFRPDMRNALNEVVPFEAVYYSPEAVFVMKRLQGDFTKALNAFASRQEKPQGKAKVISLRPKASA
ncbi:MAG TPA: hypothetical protein PLK99_02010 [Burkholderiales bacterium]|nr:hypothetical protein [Burkholderiales bacterium]